MAARRQTARNQWGLKVDSFRRLSLLRWVGITPTSYQYDHENLFPRDPEILDVKGLDGRGGRPDLQNRGLPGPGELGFHDYNNTEVGVIYLAVLGPDYEKTREGKPTVSDEHGGR
jgi:hypothetical protein